MATQNVTNEQIGSFVENFFQEAKNAPDDHSFMDLVYRFSTYLDRELTREQRYAIFKANNEEDSVVVIGQSLQDEVGNKKPISEWFPDDWTTNEEFRSKVLQAMISVKDHFTTNF